MIKLLEFVHEKIFLMIGGLIIPLALLEKIDASTVSFKKVKMKY